MSASANAQIKSMQCKRRQHKKKKSKKSEKTKRWKSNIFAYDRASQRHWYRLVGSICSNNLENMHWKCMCDKVERRKPNGNEREEWESEANLRLKSDQW